jgi:hypothetical protein
MPGTGLPSCSGRLSFGGGCWPAGRSLPLAAARAAASGAEATSTSTRACFHQRGHHRCTPRLAHSTIMSPGPLAPARPATRAAAAPLTSRRRWRGVLGASHDAASSVPTGRCSSLSSAGSVLHAVLCAAGRRTLPREVHAELVVEVLAEREAPGLVASLSVAMRRERDTTLDLILSAGLACLFYLHTCITRNNAQ